MSNHLKAVSVWGADGEVRVPRRHVHFLFGSGRLAYDCVTCEAKCCKGAGFEVAVGAELDRCLQIAPALRAFLDRPSRGDGRSMNVSNYAPGCFFLDSANRCRIHAELGYDRKPELCRLFPFNAIWMAGPHVIVTPHFNLCPLAVTEPGSESDQSRHADLYNEFLRAGLRGPLPTVWPRVEHASRLIEAEEAVVQASERHASDRDYHEFVAVQLMIGAEAEGRIVSMAECRAASRRFERRLRRVLGIDDHIATILHAEDVRTLVCTTPILRANLLFASRQPPIPFSMERTAWFMVGLGLMAALARRAGMSEIRYQTLTSLFREFRDVLELLTLIVSQVKLVANAMLRWPLGAEAQWESRYLSLIRGLLARRGVTGTPLGVVLLEHAEPGGVDHLAYLKAVARALKGVLVPADVAKPARSWTGFRARAQRWALRRFSEPTLQAMRMHLGQRGPAVKPRPMRSSRGTPLVVDE